MGAVIVSHNTPAFGYPESSDAPYSGKFLARISVDTTQESFEIDAHFYATWCEGKPAIVLNLGDGEHKVCSIEDIEAGRGRAKPGTTYAEAFRLACITGGALDRLGNITPAVWRKGWAGT